MIRRLNLKNRMVLICVVLTGLVTAGLDVAGIFIIKQYMLSRYKERISFLSNYLAVNSEVGVLIRDRAGLNSLAVNLLGEEDVISVTIMDSKDTVLVKQKRESDAQAVKTVETMIKLNKTNDENILFREYSNTPFGTLTIKGVENIGKVRIEYCTKGISLLIKEVTMRFVLISLSIMFVAIILFYFAAKKMIEDVSKLALVSKQIGAGKMDLRARLGTLPETRELAYAFNSMLDSLDKSRKINEQMAKETARSNYLAELGRFSLSIAHEIKNPLAIIKTSAEMLKKEFKVPKDHHMAQYIDQEVLRINRLIEDFLLFAKPGNMVFEDLDTKKFMEALSKRLLILYDAEPVQFGFEFLCKGTIIRADRNLLLRAIDNIVKNAVEESPENGRVFVRTRQAENLWIVTVADQGRGISRQDQKKIFEPFFTRKAKGTGLGLSLADQIVKSHNGELSAENNPDNGRENHEHEHGAVFTIVIPAAKDNTGKDDG